MAAIVLAAGASRRMGMAKQLVRLGTETLLARAVRTAFEAGLAPVVVVVAPGFAMPPVPTGVVTVVNHEAAEGMASSIRVGLAALGNCGDPASGAVIMACDQPSVTASHLQALAEGTEDVVASAYADRKGVPAYFPRRCFETLMALTGDSGARGLLHDARTILLEFGELDIDTTEDLRKAQLLYGN